MRGSLPVDRSNVAALIPAYGEGARIGDVTRRVLQFVDTALVVDDGSIDDTAGEARRAGAAVIQHAANLGKGAAIKTGLRALGARAGLRYVLLLDGDGQHLPEEIPLFLAEASRSEAAFLLGNRMEHAEEMPWVRRCTNRFMSRQIGALCSQVIPDSQCGFRMIRTDLLPIMAAGDTDHFDYETEMLLIAAEQGIRIVSVPISTVYAGECSKIQPLRDTLRFLRLMSGHWPRSGATVVGDGVPGPLVEELGAES